MYGNGLAVYHSRLVFTLYNMATPDLYLLYNMATPDLNLHSTASPPRLQFSMYSIATKTCIYNVQGYI